MVKDFRQIQWESDVIEDCRQLIRLAIHEDLRQYHDWTTASLVDEKATGTASIVAREDGVVAGLQAAELTLHEYDPGATLVKNVNDGDPIQNGQILAEISGRVRTLLAAERVMLNFLGRLCGIATLTSQFVAEVKHTKTRIYDTRKTTPGWRLLEKYAAGCGGGTNHRSGLYDAILIKDNHLAFGKQNTSSQPNSDTFQPADAVRAAREFVKKMFADEPSDAVCNSQMIIEVEVDSLEQFQDVLPAGPDIVLLDNMSLEQLRKSVALRDQIAPSVQLEASGGVNLSTVKNIAETGVDRISAGALTHSAANFDVGLDWSN